MGFVKLCKLGLALTWPLVLVGMIGLCITLVFLFR